MWGINMSKLVPSIFQKAELVMKKYKAVIEDDRTDWAAEGMSWIEDIKVLSRALTTLDGEINSVLSLTDTTCDDAKKLEAALMSSAVGRDAIEHVKFCNPELFNKRVFSGRA